MQIDSISCLEKDDHTKNDKGGSSDVHLPHESSSLNSDLKLNDEGNNRRSSKKIKFVGKLQNIMLHTPIVIITLS